MKIRISHLTRVMRVEVLNVTVIDLRLLVHHHKFLELSLPRVSLSVNFLVLLVTAISLLSSTTMILLGGRFEEYSQMPQRHKHSERSS